jgi:hypothetical protein
MRAAGEEKAFLRMIIRSLIGFSDYYPRNFAMVFALTRLHLSLSDFTQKEYGPWD